MDYAYFCTNLGNLMGLPVRVYRNDRLIHQTTNVSFEPDPVILVSQDLSADCETASFFESNYLFFGQVKTRKGRIRIVIGPAFGIRPGKEQIQALLRDLDLAQSRHPDLRLYLDSIPVFPVESFLQIICFINYIINREKIPVSDLIARKSPDNLMMRPSEKTDDDMDSDNSIHNTYAIEKELLVDITGGRPDLLTQLFSEPPSGRVGRIAHDELRQKKNTFICSATLASRAAIAGGLTQEVAFRLSDRYIQQAENLYDFNAITRLNIDMLTTYARKVENLKISGSHSIHVTNTVRYVNGHLNTRITLDDVAAHLGISRTYLCEIFKTETGSTLNQYITRQKISEAERLLKMHDYSIADISEVLGFSSQSYFQNVFKKINGQTPDQYRREIRSR